MEGKNQNVYGPRKSMIPEKCIILELFSIVNEISANVMAGF